MRTANEVGTQLIELNAKATNTDAVLKTVLQGSDRVRAYVDTETARIFFSDRAEDVFGTILHEDYHWYNSLDAEGAQALQQHALEFLAKSEGFEGIDEMIRGEAFRLCTAGAELRGSRRRTCGGRMARHLQR